MAESKPDAAQPNQPFRIEIAPRRPSFTQRLVGQSREWIHNFYQNQEKDDQAYGHGFNDSVDDYVPTVMFNNAEHRRRRNSSVSSDASVDSVEEQQVTSPTRQRTSSISERVAGMQLQRKPKSILEGYAVTNATVVDDQT